MRTQKAGTFCNVNNQVVFGFESLQAATQGVPRTVASMPFEV